MLTIYTLTYNEEIKIQFMIDHYRSRFPGCHIIVYDNSSTDRTVEIAKINNCEIRYYYSGNTLNDGLHMRIKNSCWKDAKTDWVLVCDLDELLDITRDELEYEESIGTTRISTEGWDMLNIDGYSDLSKIKYGARHIRYDKHLLFNRKHIKEINYGAGCHESNPVGLINDSNKKYKIYHYKFIDVDFVVNKITETNARLSQENINNKWGLSCLLNENDLRSYYHSLVRKAIKVRD
jgi:glycosyltransferase involved in cell wall biosynthesis